MAKQFEISAQWLKACGKGAGSQPLTVTITRIIPGNRIPGDFFENMYDVRMPDGSAWTVAAGRGRVLSAEVTEDRVEREMFPEYRG